MVFFDREKYMIFIKMNLYTSFLVLVTSYVQNDTMHFLWSCKENKNLRCLAQKS